MVNSLRDHLGKGLPQPKKAPGSRNTRFLILGTAGIALCMLGILMVFSASSVNDLQAYDSAWHHIRRQVVWFLLGLAACVVLIRIDYRRLRSLSLVSVWISGGLLLLVFIPEIGIVPTSTNIAINATCTNTLSALIWFSEIKVRSFVI